MSIALTDAEFTRVFKVKRTLVAAECCISRVPSFRYKLYNVFSVQLASSLHPQEVRPGIAVATVTGTLVTKDNRYTLEPLDLTGEPGTR